MNALDLLRRQHDEIRLHCAKLRELKNVEARRGTVNGLALLLRSHASIEEEYLYPKLEDEEETADLVDIAFRDHEHLDEILLELERTAPDDDGLLAIVDELEELLEEHLGDEERRVFGFLDQSWPKERLVELGGLMRIRFAELTASAPRPAIDPDQLPEA